MRINHNIAALNTYRQLGSANNAQQSSMEKLSSGLRINNASDDAAGLAISEKMRGQIRGLEQAQTNAQDGISMIQTAEGSLNETHSILQRMRELTVQASNDTNTETDRGEIQKEINQLTSEISRIGNNTEFNTQNLLDGTQSVTSASADASIGSTSFSFDLNTGGTDGNSISISFSSASITASNESASFDGNNSLSVELASGQSYDAADIQSIIRGASDDASNGVSVSELTVESDGSTVSAGTFDTNSVSLSGGEEGSGASFQIGANQGQQLTVEISDMRSESLGISGSAGGSATGVGDDSVSGASFTSTGQLGETSGSTEYALDVSTSDKASAATSVIDQAIERVSSERSKLGAVQNRLDHTINNLGTSSENLTAAESRIRDVDMAKEMMNQTKASILSQASQSMLAQANQMPQGVLQLLR
ncbi:flagellin [Lentibacillus cibarius]|uniref:Flagellin n=1 Tax=Lentibacillus cibarius TaxID=2583219 RepID=A0A549YEI2_9BACI|nr:flagellin [Lentibacillus cibarius]TMN21419.1 flagellin [Lentibacillus cibarius]TRM10295.1 flagellin [Lentibacillus cibarius]